MNASQIVVARGRDALTVHLYGEIDFAASLELSPRLDDVLGDFSGELRFDLQEVTLLDSEGMKMLIRAADLVRKRQGQAHVVRCSRPVRRILSLTGLNELLEVSDSPQVMG